MCGAIGGIKFRNVSDDTNYTWKFNRKGGSNSSLSAIKADKEVFSYIRDAISYAITGFKFGKVECCSHILDDAGDSWVIERSSRKFRIFKNRQAIDNDLKRISRYHSRSRSNSVSDSKTNKDWYVTEYDNELEL